ncbi:MAG: peptide chain release factor 1 [Candidatus Aureabacteria bacterium]|nr:peptide chain release factor 1 [Candidatus Auribacterota bacterium]
MALPEGLEIIGRIKADLERMRAEMAVPGAVKNPARFRTLARECSRLESLVSLHERQAGGAEELRENRELLASSGADPDFSALVREEITRLEGERGRLLAEYQNLLIPPDEQDARNIIVEIRAGTGGEEAALFAADLFRMYAKYAEKSGLKVEGMNTAPSAHKGLKEVIFAVTGPDAFRKFKFESGVHRVQRVPETEAQGRIHTSAATVAILPEAEEVELQIDPKDLRIDTFCSSGPGGQSVNTTYSAVRITHLPTDLVVSCQDEKSQHKNKAKAMRVLRARLMELRRAEREKELSRQRKEQIKSGDRSDKIRTYNFPQSRVTDHRINVSLYRLEEFMTGDIGELVDKLFAWERSEKLKAIAQGRGESSGAASESVSESEIGESGLRSR